MTNTNTALSEGMQACALDFLAHHPDPVVFYLPVWSEVDVERKLVDFQVGYANKKAAATLGAIAGQLLSQQIFHSPDHDSAVRGIWFQQLQTVLLSGQDTETRYSLAHSKGHFCLRCNRVNEGILVAVSYVTSETEALLDSQILNTTAYGLLLVEAIRNEQGAIVDFVMRKANRSFAELVTWNDSYVGKSYTSLLPEAIELFKLKCRILENGETINYRYFYEGNGKAKWFHVSLSRMGEDRLVATFSDITEAKKDEEEQRHKLESRLQIVFDTARAGMYTLIPVRNDSGEITDFRFGIVNQAVASYLGLQADELAGSLGSVYFPAYKSNGLFNRYVETMKTGNPATFDLHYADGYDHFFTINVVKMGDELFGTFTDHSPLKRLQRELETSIAELKRSNASLEQFAHAASHDLQEPLRKITLYAAKLEDNHAADLSDEAFGHLERIKTACKRMQRLIKDLLVFAEVGTNRAVYEEVALNLLLEEVVNDLEVAIAERDAIIELGELCTLKGDNLHLQQLFQNLIGNSIKYSRPNVPPHITITTMHTTGKDTDFLLNDYEAEKKFCLIKLQDNGQGFRADQAEQIFKIFQRLPQHRHEFNGTGIGLAIVQRVVENHKGYIKAEGVPGEGATFRILLPVE